MLEGVGGLRFHMVFDDLWTPRLSDTPGSQIYNGKQSQQKRAEQGKLNKSILLRHHVSLFHQSFGQHTYIAYLILQDYTMLFATMGRKPSSFCLSRHLRWLTREKEGQVRRRTAPHWPSFSLAKRHDAELSQKGASRSMWSLFLPCRAPRRRGLSEGGQRDNLSALSPLQSATMPSCLRRGPDGQ